jgi:hypothetical protein
MPLEATMLTRKTIKLERDTLAIGTIDRQRRVLTIPIGEIVRVSARNEVDGMVDILWKDRLLTMFEVDVSEPRP